MSKQKLKTHKATTKRFKIAKSGLIMHSKQNNNHLRANKTSTQKRRKSELTALTNKTEIKTIKRLIND